MLRVPLGPMEITLLLYDNLDLDHLPEEHINLESSHTLKNNKLEKRVTKTMFLLRLNLKLKKGELE